MALDPWSYADKSGTEHAHQAALFMWANMAYRFGLFAASSPISYTQQGYAKANAGPPVPQLKWLHAIHNQGRDPGQAGRVRGAIARAEGVKAGVCDLFLPVPMAYNVQRHDGLVLVKFAGFYLELKVGKNTPSEIQLEFMADMRAAGYAADWAIGWLEARKKLLDYLKIVG